MKTMARNQKFSSEQTLIRIFHRSFKREKKNPFIAPGNIMARTLERKLKWLLFLN